MLNVTNEIITDEAGKQVEQIKKYLDESLKHLRLSDFERGENRENLLGVADNNLIWAVDRLADIRQVVRFKMRGVRDEHTSS